MKLAFIDGSSLRPLIRSEGLKHCICSISLVALWILNAIPKEIAEAFIYTSSTRDVWIELEGKYGGSNGPIVYQLQREIASIYQGNMTTTKYYTKLKKH
ncbi:UNVERIFIED_CONTAM: hypothetical protein Scaly_0592000 [Sesamum calycinum]|uniref:Uncharacterized protein n=1 Tax=Sesamum calycinum TaxID=2727403 RepID=A0AAW2RSW2_9LAMI